MTSPDPLNYEEIKAWMVNVDRPERAATVLTRYLRDGGDLAELMRRLTKTAARQIITAIDEIERGDDPVVRPIRPSAPPVAQMVIHQDGGL